MFNHNFMKDKTSKDELVAFIEKTNKNIEYTHGLGYRGPTTHNKPITKEEAINIIKKEEMIDISEQENRVHINTYSENDMW